MVSAGHEVQERGVTKAASTALSAMDRCGHILREPVTWAGIGLALVASGPRGRRAAVRGVLTTVSGSALANLIIKPLVRRTRPPGSADNRSASPTSSFPSGHTTSAVAFTVGAAQEEPVLLAPLAAAAFLVGREQARSSRHFRGDVIAGAALGTAVGLVAGRVRPSARTALRHQGGAEQ
jgi:membrane-associated phospholipid phosphatase